MSGTLTVPAPGSLDAVNPAVRTESRLDSHRDRFRLFVVELSDEVGQRRNPELPNVLIEVTDRDPCERFAELKRSNRKRNADIANFGLSVRDDLAPVATWSTRHEAGLAKRVLAAEMNRSGLTVMRFDTTWRVYVIELSDDTGQRKNPEYPWVYVGETSHSIEHRYQQHTSGYRNKNGPVFNKDVYRHAVGLRPDLYADEPELHSKEESEDAERAVVDRLRSIGYSVKGGHKSRRLGRDVPPLIRHQPLTVDS